MSLASKLPWNHRFSGGYPGIGSQPLPTDADAIDYLSRMATADGAGVETGVAVAVDAFFRDARESGVLSSIRSSCVLAGARTLAGALVPLKNEGPELWTAPTPTIANAYGSSGTWDADTQTATSSTATISNTFPRFRFPIAIVAGKDYRITATLVVSDANARTYYRLGYDGAYPLPAAVGNVITLNVTRTAASGFAVFELDFDSTIGPASVTIESLSIREVIASPTNVADGFVEGDYSRTAGLTGDGTSHIDSGRSSDDDPAADCHLAVFSTSPPSGNIAMYVGGQVSQPYDIYRSNTDMQFRNGGTQVASGLGLSTGLIASTRNAADSFSIRVAGTTTTAASVARTPNDVNMFVFARNAPGGTDFISDATIAFYSIGTSLSLADLDTAVTNLITAIGNAL